MTNHTPGPWHATTADEWKTASGEHAQWGRFDISAGPLSMTAEGHYRIASVSNANDSPQNQMNAKLIAAAPELLEALRKFRDQFDAFDPSSKASRHAMRMTLIDCDAAIAKATGAA